MCHSRALGSTYSLDLAESFADGDFEIPMFVHDTLPPGVPEMKKLKADIHYSFEETPTGGRVLISTYKKTALARSHSCVPALPNRRAQNRRPDGDSPINPNLTN
jgi:hypothetical protein